MNKKKKLGEMLLEAGYIDETQLKSALSYQEEWGGRLGSIIIKRGFVTEQEMLSIIEKQFRLPSISLEGMEKPSEEVLKTVKIDIAKKFCIFPLRLEGKTLVIAISDPTDLKTLDDVGFQIGFRVKPLLALESDIMRAIEEHYEGKVGLGRTFRIDREKLKEEITPETPSEEDYEIIREVVRETPETGKLAEKAEETSQRAVMEGLIDLLVAKGIFTKEELLNYIVSKKRS